MSTLHVNVSMPMPCRYAGISDEEHRVQMSLYKSIRAGVELTSTVELEETADGDYVKATSGNRSDLYNMLVNLERGHV